MENNHRKFGDTTGKQKQYVSDEEFTSSGEEKRRKMRSRMNMKLKMMITIALMEELLKKKIVQMRPLVKPRTFKTLLLHLQKDN